MSFLFTLKFLLCENPDLYQGQHLMLPNTPEGKKDHCYLLGTYYVQETADYHLLKSSVALRCGHHLAFTDNKNKTHKFYTLFNFSLSGAKSAFDWSLDGHQSPYFFTHLTL